MRALRLSFIFVLLLAGCHAAKQSYHTETYKGRPILVGQIPVEALRKPPYKTWFEENYNEYQPGAAALDSLKTFDKSNLRIDVYMGTWCPDSREHVPHFVRVAHEAGIARKQYRIFALPRHYGDSPLVKGKNIIRVPTFIVYLNGKEAARIIEYPMQSIERDLLRILRGEHYVHDYQKQP